MTTNEDPAWQTTVLPCGHEVWDKHQVHYCDYISLDALKAIERPFGGDLHLQREPHLLDETLFIAIHQVSEICLGQAADSLYLAGERLEHPPSSAPFREGLNLVARSTQWLKSAVVAFGPFMSMTQFQQFRAHLAPASGAESINLRRLEILAAFREDTPYVDERGRRFTYRDFLDRTPGPGPDDPKTRWWTEELSKLVQSPSIWQYLEVMLVGYEVSLDDVYRITKERTSNDSTQKYGDEYEGLRALCDHLCEFERNYYSWRTRHKTIARREIGDLPGTGHTSGMAYLNSVSNTIRLFPGLQEAATKYQSG